MASPRGLAEAHGNKVVIFVSAGEINRITLRFGRFDHRPFLSMSLGVLLALVGIFGLIEFFRAMKGYRYEVGMIAFGVIGCSLMHDSLKKRYFLEVDNKSEVRRLVFSKNAKKEEIDAFCNDLKTAFRYEVIDAASWPNPHAPSP